MGAFRSFDTEHDSLLDNHGLSNIERTRGLQHTHAMGDVGFDILIGAELPQWPRGRGKITENFVRTDNPKPFFKLKRVNNTAKQTIIPFVEKTFGQEFCGAAVGTQFFEGRTPDRAGHDDLFDALSPQTIESCPCSPQAHPFMRGIADHIGIGLPLKGDNENWPVRSTARFDKISR